MVNETRLNEVKVKEGTYGKDIREPIYDALKILYDMRNDLFYKMRVTQSVYDGMQHSSRIAYLIPKE